MRRADYRWVILATGFAVLFFSSGSRFTFGLMLKPMTEDLEGSRSAISLAVTLFMVVSAVGMPLAGRLIDRYGPRWVIAAAAFFGAVGIGLVGRVSAPWQLFPLYGVIFAIGFAGTSVVTVGVMITRWFPNRRGMATSAAVSGTAIGQLVIIALLASFLATVGWRTSYAVLGAVNLVIVVPLVVASVRSRPPPSIGNGEAPNGATDTTLPRPISASEPPASVASISLDEILRSRQLWLLIATYGICGFQDFFVALHVVAFAQDQGVSTVLAGNLLALMGVMGLLGVLTSGVLSDAFGPLRPTALSFLMRIGIFALIISFQSTAAIVAFGLLYGFTFLITAPLTVVFAANMFGQRRLGTVTGLINMVHQTAGGLGAFVGAAIFDRWGSYDGAFVLMLALSLLATATTLLLRKRRAVPSGAPA